MKQLITILALIQAVIMNGAGADSQPSMEWIEVSRDGKGFVQAASGRAFVPWGFNYDRDDAGNLIEDYWDREWSRLAGDFEEMKSMGANVVRVHLQFGRFMPVQDKLDANSLKKLEKLVALAEKTGLYLDITGLGCYHKKDVPAWYEALDEKGRWKAQAAFWTAVARQCAFSPAVFCYDLMNEPFVTGTPRKAGDWLGPAFAGKHFVQAITLDAAGRPVHEVARDWVATLTAAIRTQDKRHLITVGLVDWSLDRPGLRSGFVPDKVAPGLDFLCVHLYPKRGKVGEALETLAGFSTGKPVVIEETFPLQCDMPEFERFLSQSRSKACGWIGFYWGKPPAQLNRSGSISEAITLAWLEFFISHPLNSTTNAAAGMTK